MDAWRVEQGWALEWPRYSSGAYGAYTAEQREAKRSRVGVWCGDFDKRWEWLRRQRLARD